jgi:DNA processing protein
VTLPAGGARQLPGAAYAAALASLPGVGPAWLVDALTRYEPPQAWHLVAVGDLGRPDRGRRAPTGPAWADVAKQLDVGALWARCQRNGISVTWAGAPDYPTALKGGPSPAGVLFWAGEIGTREGCPRAAVVGTRRCTPEGAAIAHQLGYDLSRAGVCVVSGLALGIDGAAHAGALAWVRDSEGPALPVLRAGSTVGVAASGVDVVYPRRHGALWREAVRLGAVISETPPGQPAQAWRFPSRNRVIAALAQIVVVVECHASGGSWHTVDAAIVRGTDVGAVPGSVYSSASVGTNMLIHEGAVPVRDARDVLDVLGRCGSGEFVGQGSVGAGPGLSPGGRGQRAGGGLYPDGGPAPSGRPSGKPQAAGRPVQPAQMPLPALGPALGRGSERTARRRLPGPAGASGTDHSSRDVLDEQVKAALGWRPLCLEEIVERSGLPVPAVVVSLDRLEQQGLVRGENGWWTREPPSRAGHSRGG